jgi:16S rRNA (cytosine967-C5)-methyltransferase
MNFVTTRDKPREQALVILRNAEEGVFVDLLLDKARESFDARDSAFLLELVYGTLRNRSRLDWALNQFSEQRVGKTDTWTRNILRIGAYQLLFLDRVPASAAVNTSTELAKTYGKKQGYVNGLLRNLDRKRSSLSGPPLGDPVKRLATVYSHPEWIVRRWLDRFGAEQTETLLRENNRDAPLVVRTNTLRTSRDGLKATLADEGVGAVETVFSAAGLELNLSPAIRTLKAYQQGLFIVQDEAAQLVSLMLSPKPGETVLDACAAPGGKATHLAEIMQNRGTIVAIDQDEARMTRIGENTRRLGCSIVSAAAGDAAVYQHGRYDKILIDAPCSGLGVLRRHPDGRWNKSEGTIRDRSAAQRRIIENCARLLHPGGVLVYATCTTEPEENEDVISSFLSGSGNAFVVDDPRPYLPEAAAGLVDERGFLHTYPQAVRMDGFCAVRIVRKT